MGILLILFIHFIADFLCMTDEMAANKSKDNYWLTLHVLIYTAVIGLFAIYIWYKTDSLYIGGLWLAFNFITHWIIDYFTSKLNSYLWKRQSKRWFFISIGFDQFIHYCCLIISYDIIINQIQK